MVALVLDILLDVVQQVLEFSYNLWGFGGFTLKLESILGGIVVCEAFLNQFLHDMVAVLVLYHAFEVGVWLFH